MNTTYFLNKAAEVMFKGSAKPRYWIGLASSVSSSGTVSGEPSGYGYSRAEILTSAMGSASSGVITNSSAISFPEATGSWGTLGNYVVYDSQTGGNLLFYGTLTNNLTVGSNTVVVIQSGELKITLTNT